jgi:hypothetical protein
MLAREYAPTELELLLKHELQKAGEDTADLKADFPTPTGMDRKMRVTGSATARRRLNKDISQATAPKYVDIAKPQTDRRLAVDTLPSGNGAHSWLLLTPGPNAA